MLSQGEREFFINDAGILDADILASNGVIHVISSVLLPAQSCETLPPAPETEAPMEPATSTDPPVLPTEAPEPVPNVTEPVQPIETEVPVPEQPIEPELEEVVEVVTNITDTNVTEPDVPEETPGESSEAPIAVDSSALTQRFASVVAVSAILPFLLLA